MEICYICGKQLSDNNSSETVKRHKEHIIHNGLYGRLKSSNILCEQCGSAYSKNDAKFIELFIIIYMQKIMGKIKQSV